MENNKEIAFEKLETLLKTKKLNDLSSADKEFILSLISLEEFEKMQEFYAQMEISSKTDVQLEPDMYIKKNLLKSFQAEPKINTSRTFLLRPIPLYQTGIAALLFLLLGFVLHFQMNKPRIEYKTLEVVKYLPSAKDTIRIVEKAPIEIASVPKYSKPRQHPNHQKEEKVLAIKHPVLTNQKQIALYTLNKAKNEKSGSNMYKDSALAMLMVRVY